MSISAPTGEGFEPKISEILLKSKPVPPGNLAMRAFQFNNSYARFNKEFGRRETWPETVNRAVSFLHELAPEISGTIYDRIYDSVLDMEVLPSMRLMAMAGPAARRNNLTLYNCSYLTVESLVDFTETLLLSMSGVGVGYSVERRYVDKLPPVANIKNGSPAFYAIPDTTEGWVEALRLGLEHWFSGEDIKFDYSFIRPAGTPLVIKGGTASGPESLMRLLSKTREIIRARAGSYLRPIDAHDIMTMIGWACVSGGVRRSALIALFDMGDEDMLNCKNNGNIVGNEHRYRANNSVVLEGPLSRSEFEKLMASMHDGLNGEPGIFSRYAANATVPERRSFEGWFVGTNPCGEISLRPRQLCNLSIAIARPEDTINSLAKKVELATIIGTIQATATYFPGMREDWAQNCEEERLLGVDINGQMDSPLVRDSQVLSLLRDHAVSVNQKYSNFLGINQSAAVTCVKPSGNSSVLVDSSPGMHPRFSHFYIRRVRLSDSSPMHKLLVANNYPVVPDVGQGLDKVHTWVVEFPIKSPEGAVVNGDLNAVQQLDYWLLVKKNWTEHNPSQTIYYREEELPQIIDWLYDNQNFISGLSFLPKNDHTYELAPYEEITEDQYETMVASLPSIDFSMLAAIDAGVDNTSVAQELACAVGGCDDATNDAADLILVDKLP